MSGGAKCHEDNEMEKREENATGCKCTILDRVIKEGLPDKVPFEQIPEGTAFQRKGTVRTDI